MDGVGGRKQEREQRVSSLEAREAGDHDALHEALRDDVCGLLVPDGVIPDEHLAVREGALFQFLVVGDRERLNDGAEAIDTGPPFASQHRLLTLGDRAVRLVAVLRGIFLGRGPLRERRPRPSAPRPPGQTGDHRRAVDVFRKCSGRDAAVAGAGGARDEVGGAHPGAERGPTQAAFLRGPRARGNPRGVASLAAGMESCGTTGPVVDKLSGVDDTAAPAVAGPRSGVRRLRWMPLHPSWLSARRCLDELCRRPVLACGGAAGRKRGDTPPAAS
eukprot:CAMPEP_0175782708 /NCGR_PEP_ID=MMETSP0097-20121207/77924_1 /TAXON_ID=311494 /ORGANISM="Alexandrium monilatum, Strain CCMP3105" /LENGTH=273 /DNA_ID=CAMNT_0017093541 /DNA_START=113 /DNA_END=935 /DNA_ORIENTATION=+